MSDLARLERRYRRLLAFYPEAFRREHEEEMLSVLLAGASEDQRRPSRDEAIDLVGCDVVLVPPIPTGESEGLETGRLDLYEYRHHRLLWGFRIVWGLVLLGVAGFALSSGSWWALFFLAGAAADFVFGYRIYQIAQSQPPT